MFVASSDQIYLVYHGPGLTGIAFIQTSWKVFALSDGAIARITGGPGSIDYDGSVTPQSVADGDSLVLSVDAIAAGPITFDPDSDNQIGRAHV